MNYMTDVIGMPNVGWYRTGRACPSEVSNWNVAATTELTGPSSVTDLELFFISMWIDFNIMNDSR